LSRGILEKIKNQKSRSINSITSSHLGQQHVENNRIRGEIAHSKTQRSHKYVNNAWKERSNSPPTLLFIPFPVPPH
jgi:hypothetical protein